MTPETTIIPVDQPIVLEAPAELVEEQIEQAIAGAVAEGVRAAVETENEEQIQWARLSYEVLNAMLKEQRQSQTEQKNQLTEMIVRLKDSEVAMISLKSKLDNALAPQLPISPVSIPTSSETETPVVEPVEVTDIVVEPVEVVEENPAPKTNQRKRASRI
jgi:hypothetical protein